MIKRRRLLHVFERHAERLIRKALKPCDSGEAKPRHSVWTWGPVHQAAAVWRVCEPRDHALVQTTCFLMFANVMQQEPDHPVADE